MVKFAKRQKISMYGVNNEIVPAQVSEVINVDDAKIDSYKSAVAQKYDAVIGIANSLSTIAKKADDKKFAGKPQQCIDNIRTYMNNQSKYWGEEKTALSNQIKTTKDDLNTVVDAMSYITQIDTILKGNVSDAERVLLTRQRTADARAVTSAGFSVGSDGSLSSKGVSYTIKDGKVTNV